MNVSEIIEKYNKLKPTINSIIDVLKVNGYDVVIYEELGNEDTLSIRTVLHITEDGKDRYIKYVQSNRDVLPYIHLSEVKLYGMTIYKESGGLHTYNKMEIPNDKIL